MLWHFLVLVTWPCKLKEMNDKTNGVHRTTLLSSVPNSSDGLIFVKRRALDGPFLDKNTGFRRAHRRAKFTFLIFSFYLNLPKKSKLSKISFLATLVREGTIKLNVWKY